jgi:hypothetical protein
MLAGYGHRTHGAEAVLDDLELRAFWLQSPAMPKDAACIVTADLIAFSAPLTSSIRSELSERFGLRPEAILLAASHTHSGPQTAENMTSVGGPPVADYIDALRQSLVGAVAAARDAVAPATLHLGRGRLEGYAINRRRRVKGEIAMAPNPMGTRDDEVSTIVFKDTTDGNVRALLYHFTCHPTVMGDYRITGDYPGAARRHIERQLNGARAGFLPGCFGDVRPACVVVGGQSFRRGEPEDVEAFGSALAAEVVRVTQDALGQALQPKCFARSETVDLPLAAASQRVPLSLQRLDLAEELMLIALGGEICVDYGHFIKALRPRQHTLPIGYSNGMVGYVCPARLLTEGGYEPEQSCSCFGLASPFRPDIERIIQEAVINLAHG